MKLGILTCSLVSVRILLLTRFYGKFTFQSVPTPSTARLRLVLICSNPCLPRGR
ncbi:hypothetical protein BofuT4_P014150.1 [Botrytis cinerea T4]|uniref:Uncharacterized protein n=1 Tax=Botryotinia fuckeliana (strain T4) TaxID=999810 RepID=G2XN31_BOTF4|nr:hypothetical protein BofuT4_P014150.1 [Botrytis cinerea T4]